MRTPPSHPPPSLRDFLSSQVRRAMAEMTRRATKSREAKSFGALSLALTGAAAAAAIGFKLLQISLARSNPYN